MAASNFKQALSLVLAHEGGFINHPSDPGGPTNKGVTQRVYDAYREYHGSKKQSVKHIADTEVADIYNKNYWRLVRADSLPCGLDYAVFDFAVNSGVSRACRYLQRTVGVEQDGIIGLMTLTAIEKVANEDEEKLIVQYCANRLAFVRSLPTFKVFGKGWTRRIVGYHAGVQDNDSGVVDYAITMARRDPVFKMPTSIGEREDEIAAKAISGNDDIPLRLPQISTADELKKLALENDQLAAKVNNG